MLGSWRTGSWGARGEGRLGWITGREGRLVLPSAGEGFQHIVGVGFEGDFILCVGFENVPVRTWDLVIVPIVKFKAIRCAIV